MEENCLICLNTVKKFKIYLKKEYITNCNCKYFYHKSHVSTLALLEYVFTNFQLLTPSTKF